MPSGITRTGSLADSLPDIRQSARIVQEQEGVMAQAVSREKLGEGVGLGWNEVTLAKMTAQNVGEADELYNPQLLEDSLLTITPTVTGIQTLITDRVARRISKNVWAKTGALAQNAMQRKKDIDGLALFASATTTLGAAGSTATFGHVASGKTQISCNVTEPAVGPFHVVLHGFVIKDFWDELTAPLGTDEITSGETARALREGYQGNINGARVFADGNIPINGCCDARGGIFAKRAYILVEGHGPRTEVRREPHIGGGADSLFMYDEFAYGRRSAGGSGGGWDFGLLFDATAPTS